VSDAPPVGVKGTLLLCDFAQAVGGKLYILGGGWSKAVSWGQPVNMTLAIKLDIPWHLANTKLAFEIALLTEDGKQVVNPSVGQPIRGEGQIEIGRPAGLTPGTALDATMAAPMFGLQLPHGSYRWELKVSEQLVQTVSFEVVPPPPGFVIPPMPPPA
jgi:hypothetical protein